MNELIPEHYFRAKPSDQLVQITPITSAANQHSLTAREITSVITVNYELSSFRTLLLPSLFQSEYSDNLCTEDADQFSRRENNLFGCTRNYVSHRFTILITPFYSAYADTLRKNQVMSEYTLLRTIKMTLLVKRIQYNLDFDGYEVNTSPNQDTDYATQ